ncbi:glycosyltransferase [Tamlana fucoidanivorans]|uniref:Glycosyltransferase n=1 Tax=Allotamlana fucoidanivorans TaxID=2583814 RepID=A0A5C4SSE6_9FLAO|nr:glycosyltransferase [Tamlana fucoidanivorans]TNJ46531.1 glycosyltransferase [Tamlana fucoidanivorans]
MKLSIIVPVYNAEKYISRCLESLLCQDISVDQYEIVIIDDGSTDKSCFIVKEFMGAYSNVKLYTQKNSGVGVARNKGIELALGEYIYFIDADDYLADNVLNVLLNTLTKHDLEILAFKSIATTNPHINNILDKKEGRFLECVKTGVQIIADMPYKNEVWWYFVKRSFLLATRIQFIKGRWMEDAIFTTKLFLKANRVLYFDIDAHRHMVVPNSAMTSRESVQFLRVIRDNANAAIVFKDIIDNLDKSIPFVNSCIKRLKTRQQSFVFFMMVRMLSSAITLQELKAILTKMTEVSAYPLNSFLGKEYGRKIYYILVPTFNIRHLFYISFIVGNPFLKWVTHKKIK